MPSPHVKTTASLQPALELIYLATLEPGQASQNLRELLLDNPNYFGSLTENSFRIVLNINGDTAFESLGCVRYIPLFDQIYASINIKRGTGYSFQVGHPSSREYIRFYLSHDRGVTWQDRGFSAVNVVDEPEQKPRLYLVTKKVNLLEEDRLNDTVMVRAILSWNSLPPSEAPDWIPLWGNVAETQIRVGSRYARPMPGLEAKSKVQFANKSVLRAGSEDGSDRAKAASIEMPTPAGFFHPSSLQFADQQVDRRPV